MGLGGGFCGGRVENMRIPPDESRRWIQDLCKGEVKVHPCRAEMKGLCKVGERDAPLTL